MLRRTASSYPLAATSLLVASDFSTKQIVGRTGHLRTRLHKCVDAESALWSWLAPVFAIALFAGPQLMTFPIMDGWSYFPLGSAEYFPYRDYFYPVTPLTFFEARIFALFPDPLLASRLIMLVLPALLASAVMSLASAFVSKRDAFTVSALLVSTLGVLRLEALAGWNTQFFVYTAVGIALAAKSWTTGVGKPRKASNSISPMLYAILAGTAFSLAMMVKQTTIVTVAVIVVGLVLWLRLRFGARVGRRGLVLSAATLVVPGLSIAMLAIYLESHRALGPFVWDMLSAGGKNPDLFKGLGAIWSEINLYLLNPASLVVLLLIVLILLAVKRDLTWNSSGIAARTLFAVVALLAYLVLETTLVNTPPGREMMIAIALCCASIAVFPRRNGIVLFAERGLAVRTFVAIFVIPVLVGAFRMRDDFPGYLEGLASVERRWISFSILGTIILTYATTSTKGYQVLSSLFSTDEPTRRRLNSPDSQSVIIVLAILSAVGSLVNVFSSGGTLYMQFFIPSLAIFLAVLIRWIRGRSGSRLLLPSLVSVVYGSTVVFICAAIVAPYSWFGWKEESLLNGPRSWSAEGYLSGIALSPQSKGVYDRLGRAETVGAELSGAQDPTLFTFPNLPGAASLTALRPYGGLPCVVLWFDVCPNELAEKSLERFSRNPAQVIVWTDPPEEVIGSDEATFIRGRSAIRDWLGYRNAEVLARRWVLVDTIPVTTSSPNRWPISVYSVDPAPDPSPDANFGSISMSPSAMEVNAESVGSELTDGWFWTGGDDLTITIKSIGSTAAVGTLNFRLEASPCLVSAQAILRVNGLQERVKLGGDEDRVQSVAIPYTVLPGDSLAVSISPVEGGCYIGADVRRLAVKVSDFSLSSQ